MSDNNSSKKISGRVLIVDDSVDIHRAFETVLQNPVIDMEMTGLLDDILGQDTSDEISYEPEFDLQLDFAEQGQQAIDKIKDAKKCGRDFDVVFMDLRMPPGMDGLEAVRHIRNDGYDLPVIFCSAYSDYSKDVVLSEMGDSDVAWVEKPFTAPAIRSTLARYLKKLQ